MTDLKDIDSLFKQVSTANIKARDFMDKSMSHLKSDYSIKSSIQILKVNGASGGCIVDSSGKLIGIITQHDLLIQASSQNINNTITYNNQPISVKEDDELKPILLLMLTKKLKFIPVINTRKEVVGTISRLDLLNKLVES